jgi:hypothetical protein
LEVLLLIVYSNEEQVKLLQSLTYIREKMTRLEIQGRGKLLNLSDKQYAAYQTYFKMLLDTADILEEERKKDAPGK